MAAGLFTLGFVGGLFIWLAMPQRSAFADIRVPYFITLGFFVLHKIEEREIDFFPALSQLTGVPVPEASSPYCSTLAAGWLQVPLLMPRRYSFGYYLAWTFFTSMGEIELAHFLFPLFVSRLYGYFPGTVSVVPLAPAACWGLYRMTFAAAIKPAK
ncbi:hypothetical protein NKH69_09215 [Mesorhizobium sp. M0976]|uniref:hypothetical protein n=1 Tax=unclassified Mesorhizobium TaxID=325217 RepID=UPI00333CCF7C